MVSLWVGLHGSIASSIHQIFLSLHIVQSVGGGLVCYATAGEAADTLQYRDIKPVNLFVSPFNSLSCAICTT